MIERVGNRLPDQITIFVGLGILTLLASTLAARAGLAVGHPATGERIVAFDLLSRDGLQWVLTNVVANFTGFAPLGIVLVAMIGIGVAEQTGLFAALLKLIVLTVPGWAVTPAVMFAGVLSHTAGDAGFVILPPLAAALYASLGRHPFAGVAAAFAGVAAGFSANVLISTLDPLLAGMTQEAARLISPQYSVNALCNYYFLAFSGVFLTFVGWCVSVRIVEPHFGNWSLADAPPGAPAVAKLEGPTPIERRGMLVAGIVFLLTIAGIALLVVPDNGVLRDPAAPPGDITSYEPFFNSMIGLILLIFVLPGLAYGLVTRQIRSDADVANMMGHTIGTMGRYIVMAFFAGQFIRWFGKSNLGFIVAIEGADLLRAVHLTGFPLMIAFVLVTSVFEMLMASASAKWALMGPIFVPMFMLVGMQPETTQALYRIGDSVTNVVNPVNVYFPIVLAAAQRYVPDARFGKLLAVMVPYSIVYLITWTAILLLWVWLGWPLGPGSAH